jgi:hypothetical protein
VLATVLAIGLPSYALVPPVRDRVNPVAVAVWHKTRSVFSPRYVPVRPATVTASDELPDHPAAAAVDMLTITYWAAPEGAAEPALVVSFEHPVNLRRAIIRNGVGPDFGGHHRARDLHLVLSTGHTVDVTLSDTPDPQMIDIPGGSGANQVEIQVRSLYRAADGQDVAIAEIEFFEQRS